MPARAGQSSRMKPSDAISLLLIGGGRGELGEGGGEEVFFSSLPHVSFFPFHKCFLLQNWCFLPLELK